MLIRHYQNGWLPPERHRHHQRDSARLPLPACNKHALQPQRRHADLPLPASEELTHATASGDIFHCMIASPLLSRLPSQAYRRYFSLSIGVFLLKRFVPRPLGTTDEIGIGLETAK
jgi:hypothetical protein